MNPKNLSGADAILDRHLAALRNSPDGASPSGDRVQATLAVLRKAGERRQSIPEIIFLAYRKPAVRYSFVGVLCAGLSLLLFSPLGATVAMADVAMKLKDAKTLSLTMTLSLPKQSPVVMHYVMNDQGQIRTELSGRGLRATTRPSGLSIGLDPGGTVEQHFVTVVTVVTGRQTVVIDDVARTATQCVFDGARRDDYTPAAFLDGLRHLGDSPSKPAGTRTVDGAAVNGFTTTLNGNPVTVWADAKTAVPVRLEWTVSSLLGVQVVMDQFKLDAPVDPELFSLAVPAGYTVGTQRVEEPNPGPASKSSGAAATGRR